MSSDPFEESHGMPDTATPPKIEFLCAPEDLGVIAEPVPAREALPDWFRRLPAVDKQRLSPTDNALTVKRCMPFLDALTAGWILPLAATVRIETIEAHPLTLSSELSGRIAAPRIAEVRARVAGVVLKRVYREGSDVKQGDVLFLIDPAPFKADHDSARATLAKSPQRMRVLMVGHLRHEKDPQTYFDAVRLLRQQGRRRGHADHAPRPRANIHERVDMRPPRYGRRLSAASGLTVVP